MAYSELIKSFSRIRTYMRSFYVYGFKHRNDYDEKSARGYDNERRRIESWLGNYMSFRQDEDGRRVFLSVDSRAVSSNPLYRAFRAKSFTDRDITLYFQLLDMLSDTEGMAIFEIMEELADRLNTFDMGDVPDESTVRKKLKEYKELDLVTISKSGRETVYCRSNCPIDLGTWWEALAFFSEAVPLGVIGSFVQELLPDKAACFRFKHHYILNSLDSEILCDLALAMSESRLTELSGSSQRRLVLPLRFYISTQTGRQYVLCWSPQTTRFSFWRLDLIDSVKAGERFEAPPGLPAMLRDFQRHVWGVAAAGKDTLEHLEMTVYAAPDESFIVQRLEREKRGGTVEQLDETHWRFSIDAYDTLEMLPWLRTFIGRITDFKADNPVVRSRFVNDLDAMGALYGGESVAVP